MKFYKQNMQDWIDGNSPLFITGISGSGKTTMAKRLADNENEIFNIDAIFAFARFSKNEILEKYAHFEKNLNDLFIKFVNSVPDELFLYRTADNDQEVCDASMKLFREFIMLWKKEKLSGKRYIIEGFPIYLDEPMFYKDKPLIVMAEPYVLCCIRAYKRDRNSKEANKKYADVNFKKILFKKRILMMFSNKNIHFRELKTFKNFLKTIKKLTKPAC